MKRYNSKPTTAILMDIWGEGWKKERRLRKKVKQLAAAFTTQDNPTPAELALSKAEQYSYEITGMMLRIYQTKLSDLMAREFTTQDEVKKQR